MKDTLILQDKNYISAKRVHELFGYTSDYVGQLCRAGKLDCRMVGRSWFVTEKSIIEHKTTINEIIKTKARRKTKTDRKDSLQVVSEEKTKLLLPPPIECNTSVDQITAEIVLPKLFKYESENKPFIPELKKEIAFVPAIFSMPSLSSVIIGQPLSVASKNSPLNVKVIFLATVLLLISSFTFSFGTNLKNVFSNVAPQSYASLASVSTEIIKSINRGFNGVSNILVKLINGESSDMKMKIAVEKPAERFNGLAVVPSSNSLVQDEIIKQKIRDSFSDEITIKPDRSGTAGVITPVFKKAKGDDFVYVLVPVKN